MRVLRCLLQLMQSMLTHRRPQLSRWTAQYGTTAAAAATRAMVEGNPRCRWCLSRRLQRGTGSRLGWIPGPADRTPQPHRDWTPGAGTRGWPTRRRPRRTGRPGRQAATRNPLPAPLPPPAAPLPWGGPPPCPLTAAAPVAGPVAGELPRAPPPPPPLPPHWPPPARGAAPTAHGMTPPAQIRPTAPGASPAPPVVRHHQRRCQQPPPTGAASPACRCCGAYSPFPASGSRCPAARTAELPAPLASEHPPRCTAGSAAPVRSGGGWRPRSRPGRAGGAAPAAAWCPCSPTPSAAPGAASAVRCRWCIRPRPAADHAPRPPGVAHTPPLRASRCRTPGPASRRGGAPTEPLPWCPAASPPPALPPPGQRGPPAAAGSRASGPAACAEPSAPRRPNPPWTGARSPAL
mmetsp:Transcript_12448/g.37428  ORF Transcript_12448/g.37428 Transcript_12448/m.37428 type:complete len:405 (+) Transcript_12448:1310-2524(+)